jgi:hypothetical protein
MATLFFSDFSSYLRRCGCVLTYNGIEKCGLISHEVVQSVAMVTQSHVIKRRMGEVKLRSRPVIPFHYRE